MTGPPRRGPTRPPIPHHPSCAPDVTTVIARTLTLEHSPGMGGRPEVVTDLYTPEGVAVLVRNALRDAGLLCTPDERRMLDEVEQAIADSTPTDPEVQAIFDLCAAANAVVDAAIAETRAEQEAVRRTTAALDAPNRSPALTAAGDAQRTVRAARTARRDAVQRLLQHRQDRT